MVYRHTCTFLVSLAIVVSLSTAPSVHANDFSMFGGRTLGAGTHAIGVGIGYPGLFFEYDYGFSSVFDLGFRFELDYGFPPGDFLTSLGFVFDVPMRFKLLSRGKVHVAFKLEPGLVLGFIYLRDRWDFYYHRWHKESDFYLGLRVSPGVAVNVDVHRMVSILAGLDVPIHIIWMTDPNRALGAIPLAIHFGTELGVTKDINVLVQFRVGPSIFVLEDELHTDVYLNVYVGGEFKF